MSDFFPPGKLPPELLNTLLTSYPLRDKRVVIGPGVGFDCAVLEMGNRYLVLKSDPITFATEEIGWYAVQVNANDIVTTGAIPRWFLVTLLLPEGKADELLVSSIYDQLHRACKYIGVSIIGGHTEITHGLDRPIISGTMIGEVEKDRLISPDGARAGDAVLLTKGVPIEATAIIASEFGVDLLENNTYFYPKEIQRAKEFLHNPGISVFRDAQIAVNAGEVTAMHDPTEGGIAGALWELAAACKHDLHIDSSEIHIPEISRKIIEYLQLDPLACIASGALLLTVRHGDVSQVQQALLKEGITSAVIGRVEEGDGKVWETKKGENSPFTRPERDELGKLFETGEE